MAHFTFFSITYLNTLNNNDSNNDVCECMFLLVPALDKRLLNGLLRLSENLLEFDIAPEILENLLENVIISTVDRVGRYQKCKTSLDFTEARDSEWQWHQLGHTQVCTSLQTDNHTSTPPLSFLQTGCPSCHPTNSVKALEVCWILDRLNF